VRATVFADAKQARWLPRTAVLSLGMDKVVFLKEGKGFRASKLSTGIVYNDYVQVLEGLGDKDEVAINAQFLTDSESFIKVKSEQ
jgi:Cu(I)/Ag(I) efflux system membrane fusion protein